MEIRSDIVRVKGKYDEHGIRAFCLYTSGGFRSFGLLWIYLWKIDFEVIHLLYRADFEPKHFSIALFNLLYIGFDGLRRIEFGISRWSWEYLIRERDFHRIEY